MKKRLLSMLLATLMAFSVAIPTLAADDTGYDDVKPTDWYAAAAKYMKDAGLMTGTDVGFSADGTFTRAQLATVLYRMAGSPPVTGEDSFPDTESDRWYSNAVLWSEQNKIVGGYDTGLYGTNDPTTQEQLITMLWRDAGRPESAGSLNENASEYAREAIRWAESKNILQSGVGYTFAPKSAASRAQVAVIVTQYLQSKEAVQESPVASAKKTLVLYFSAADNDGIDAVSSATVVAHEGKDYGAAQLAAKFVGDYTGADVSAIVTEQPYPAEYSAMADMAKEQVDNKVHPALSSKIENLADYDTVFMVYPVWWYMVPMPIYSVLDQYDFSSKTIIPVITHAGSRDGGTLSVLRAEEPSATVLDNDFVSAASNIASQKAAVESWLDGLTEYWK